MEHRDHHGPLAERALETRTRLSTTQLGLVGGVALLLITLEILLVYTYVGIGRANDRQEAQGVSTTLMANIQRETLQLALKTSRLGAEGTGELRVQRAVLENQLGIAHAAATTAETRLALERMQALLEQYDRELVLFQRQDAKDAERILAPLLDRLELEAKQAYDRVELGFYETTSHTLRAEKRSQMFLLGMGGLVLLLTLPLAFSLYRMFGLQLRRLSAFPRLSPFPVVALAEGEIRFANAATRTLADELVQGDVELLLPSGWSAMVDQRLEDPGSRTVSHEVDVRGRTILWSFSPVISDGVVHGYGDDITARKRAEEALRKQSALSAYEAQHDALTGLGNRRKLMDDAARNLPRTSAELPLVLAIFDLDGFKTYNDTFGHPAGDALLTRLGEQLRDALPDDATAYRMGGDEFCLLADSKAPEPLVAAALAALHEEGEVFSIGATAGYALLPAEASTIIQALQLADQRLYAAKRSSRASAGAQARDALLQVLVEQDPRLASHVSTVAELAGATAASLGLSEDEVAQVQLAAELHDIGKAAIPDAILEKRGPLDRDEWGFVKRHTLIGERILAAAPGLVGIATIVRSSHERFDGNGYPDGLVGNEIPLQSRIIGIADAFDAMVTKRSYRVAMTALAALDEIRRCAGTQFDPAVVEAFVAVAASRYAHPSAA